VMRAVHVAHTPCVAEEKAREREDSAEGVSEPPLTEVAGMPLSGAEKAAVMGRAEGEGVAELMGNGGGDTKEL
jgi:hypothetical protein